MNTPIIDVETSDGLFLVTPMHVFGDNGHHTDVDMPADLVGNRGDFGYATGRFCQFDDGTNTAFNRNGNMFAPTEYIDDAAKLVRYTPLNMLHRRRDVIGTFVGTSVVDPKGALAGAAMDAASGLPFPYIDALSAIWKYHFPEEWALINQSFEQGSCFLSMEAVAKTLTCMTPGCSCDSATFDYMGQRHESYCDSLKQARAKKRLNYPHFLGGAMVVPPAMPAWRRADITKISASVEAHPDQAEMIYEQIAATASHLDAAEWEFLMAMVLAGAYEDDALVQLSQADVDRIFACMAPDLHDSGQGAAEAEGEGDDEGDDEAEDSLPIAAGLAVVAADSGRVLMLQRAVDPADPAGGLWEFPGGKIDPEDASPLAAAQREFSEEIGCNVPDGHVSGTWVSPNGIYQAFVYLVSSESDVQCNLDPNDRHVLNPDDPDGDNIEVAAWWDPLHLPDMAALRPEVQTTDWDQIRRASESPNGIDPAAVNYTEATDEDTRCGDCAYFDALAGTCALVAGSIDPDWVCDLFTPQSDGAELEPVLTGVTRLPAGKG